MNEPVAIVGAAAVSAYGFQWRGLSQAVRDRALAPTEAAELAPVRAGARGFAVAEIPPELDASDPKNRKLMARAARLAAVAARAALADAGWKERRDQIGYFLGIGSAGGPLEELRAMLLASLEDGKFSEARFTRQGLAATNPLFAFHLLTNFTLCHGAIAESVGGPNGAYFSRGSGTLVALGEAVQALQDGDCDRVLVGGADTALYPGTFLELGRAGHLERGLIPAEGAALLALARNAHAPLAQVAGWALDTDKDRPIGNRVADLLGFFGDRLPSELVLAPCSAPVRERIRGVISRKYPYASVLDATAGLGESLAATPALAWLVGLDWLTRDSLQAVLVVSAGIDGDLGAVLLQRGGAS